MFVYEEDGDMRGKVVEGGGCDVWLCRESCMMSCCGDFMLYLSVGELCLGEGDRLVK